MAIQKNDTKKNCLGYFPILKAEFRIIQIKFYPRMKLFKVNCLIYG